MADNRYKKLVYVAVVVFVFFMLAVPLYNKFKGGESVTYTRTLMGTVVQITLMEGGRASFDLAAESAFAEIKRQEGIFSNYKPDSDVSRIASSAGASQVEVSPEVIKVLKSAVMVAEASGGAFDPTIGVLGKVWGFSGEKKYVPTKEEMEEVLPFVDYRQIMIDEVQSKAGLGKKGMTLNLGGIAKGYIVSRAVDVLKEKGVTRGIIHAGGDMTVFQKGTGKPFVIGIQHPREKKLLGEAYVDSGAVSTSGDYERYFEKDGVRYHHILDPKTGFPARLCQSVTIISKEPALSDGLSTAVFVMGPEKGMALIEKMEGVEGVIVDAQGKVTVSKGFKGKILE